MRKMNGARKTLILLAVLTALILGTMCVSAAQNADEKTGGALKNSAGAPAALQTVTYNYAENGGSSATKTTATVEEGAAIDLSPTATKLGWSFAGWHTNRDATTGLTGLTAGSSQVTLYAIYSKKVTITLIDYADTRKETRAISATLYNKETSRQMVIPPQNTRTGWQARGYSNRTVPEDWAQFSPVGGTYSFSGDFTYYGVYYRTLSLHYNPNGGSGAPEPDSKYQFVSSYDVSKTLDPAFTVAGPPARLGYAFDRWAMENPAGTGYEPGQTVVLTENATLVATWKVDPNADEYGNTFEDAWVWTLTPGQTNSLSGAIQYAKDADVFRFVAPVSGTWRFHVTDQDASLKYLDGTLYDESEKLLATIWQQLPGKSIDYTRAMTAGQTCYLKLNGAAGTGGYTLHITPPADPNLRVVTYNFARNGGVSATKTSASLSPGAAVDLTPVATKTGWTFIGWNTDPDATVALSSLTMGANNVTLYGLFRKTVTLTLRDFSGTEPATRTVETTLYNNAAAGAASIPPLHAMTGWQPRGWGEARPDGTVLASSSGGTLQISDSMTLYGLYEKTNTVTYDAGGGTPTPQPQSGTAYASAAQNGDYLYPVILLPGAIQKDGFRFNGWRQNSLSGTAFGAGEIYTIYENTVMIAEWRDASLPEDDYGNTFETAHLWTLKPDETNSLNGVTNYAKDDDFFRFTVPVSGLWRIHVTDQSSSLIFLDALVYNGAKTRIHMAWQLTSPVDFTLNLAAGQTYYLNMNGFSGVGGWKLHLTPPAASRTVTYDYGTNGGTSASKASAQVNPGEPVDLSPFAHKEGWSFLGWNTDANATGPLDRLIMGSAPVTLYAIYSRTLDVFLLDYSAEEQLKTRTEIITIYNKATTGQVTIPAVTPIPNWIARGWGSGQAADEQPLLPSAGGQLEVGGSGASMIFLYGLYRQNVQVSYDANGGANPPPPRSESIFLCAGNPGKYKAPVILLPAAIQREGYEFAGWRENSPTGTLYGAGEIYTIYHDTVLFAGWKEIVDPNLDEYGNTFETAWNWTLKGDVVNSLNGRIQYAKDDDFFKFVVPVTGSWRFQITNQSPSLVFLDGFLYNGGQEFLIGAWQGKSSIQFTFHLVEGETCYLKLQGFSGTGAYTLSATPPTTGSRTVTYNYAENGGSSATLTSARVNPGMAIDLSPAAGKANWSFLGWNTDPAARTGLTSLTMGAADVTLYAIYAKTLTITIVDYNGTTKTTTKRAEVIYNKQESAAITLPPQNPFTGWLSRGFSPKPEPEDWAQISPEGGHITTNTDLTYYGIYYRSISLKYNANGGSAAPEPVQKHQFVCSYDITKTLNPVFTLAAATERFGYLFEGWTPDLASGPLYAPGTPLTLAADGEIYAVWKADPDGDDYENSFEKAYAWTVGADRVNSLDGVINYAKDNDFFQFVAPAGGTWRFYITDQAPTLKYLDIYLYNEDRFQIARVLQNGPPVSLTYSLSAGQKYYVKLEGFEGTGAYTIHASRVSP